MSPLPIALELPAAVQRGEWQRVALSLLLLKCALLLLDPNLRFFMGDSGSYLHAALTDWIPPDRSFTYPWLVYVSAVLAQSAFALVLLQSLFGVCTALLLFWMLRRGARLPMAWAAAPALLLALEPTQLFYERMLMAESAALLALMGCVASVLAYVRSGRLRWAVLLVLAGLLAVSMRMSALPVVLGMTALAPLLRAHSRHSIEDTGRPFLAVLRLGLHLFLVLAMTVAAHAAYKRAYGALTEGKPEYMREQGRMRLGLVAPLVKPEHLKRVGLPVELLDQLGHTLNDHRTRELQIWSNQGLWAKIRDAQPPSGADAVAGKIAVRALQGDPLGLLRMGGANLLDYFDSPTALSRLHNDAGDSSPDPGMIRDLRTHLRYDARDLYAQPGIAAKAFLGSRWWLTSVFLVLAPLALMVMWRYRQPGQARSAAWVIGFAGLGLFASHLLFSHIVSFRYLHPMPPFALASLALLFAPRPSANARSVDSI
jgi:uncharacterized membrane protein